MGSLFVLQRISLGFAAKYFRPHRTDILNLDTAYKLFWKRFAGNETKTFFPGNRQASDFDFTHQLRSLTSTFSPRKTEIETGWI